MKIWHREAIGGNWDKFGKLQYDFLLDKGLKSHHYLLDLGCGSLRGGVLFIPYLEDRHYYGVEKEPRLLEAAQVELKEYKIEKIPLLFHIENFDLSPIDAEFDFMLAQSVLTHLRPNMIELCLSKVVPKLKEDGHFYATFHHMGKTPRKGSFNRHPWRRNEVGRAEYKFEFFEELAEKFGIKITNLGKWGHPASSMLDITK